MINLIIAILCSATIGLILKYSETRQKNRLAVTTSNYFVAFAVSLILILNNGLPESTNPPLAIQSFFKEFYSTITLSESFSATGSFGWSVVLGVVGGIFYFLGFILIQQSINKNGVGITGAFSKISILIPIVLSIILWNENPSVIQAAGIFLTVFALILMTYPENSNKAVGFNSTLLSMFLFVGLAEFSNKLFQAYAQEGFNSLFLFFVFLTAFFVSILVTLKKNRTIHYSDIIIGCLVGIPNMLTSYFLIKSFATIKASIVFPVYSSATIVLMALGGTLIFSEKLKKRELSAISIIIIALIFLNR